MTFFIKNFLKYILTLFMAFALLSPSLLAKEMTQEERNKIAVQLIPIITMLLLDGDSVAPTKPTLTTSVPSVSSDSHISVEVNGEVGSTVYVNGVAVGTIGANGKATVALSFVNGDNTMSITLKDKAGNESVALTFSVAYDAPPVITLNGDLYTMLTKGDSYTEEGATSVDANDGTVSVDVNGTVDTNTVGEYNITYSATDSHGHTAHKVRGVHVLPVQAVVVDFPFDITEVEGYDGATDPDNLLGIIKNQFWIQAFGKLTEIELREAVASYGTLTVIGYSPSSGLLVEIPTNSIEAKSAIKTLELDADILKVRNRIYKSSTLLKTNEIALPNDSYQDFDDLGANWHLEYIHIPKAWEITKGSTNVAIGVIDKGFVLGHEDLIIKDGNRMTTKIDSHGSACASIIGAITNNKKGMSGINMESPLVVSYYKDSNAIQNIFKSEDGSIVKVINQSTGIDWEETIKTVVKIKKPSKELASNYYKKHYDVIVNQYGNRLYVFSAGNDGNDAEIDRGAMHKDSKNDNIIVVAALLKDGRLPEYSNYGDTVDIAAPTSVYAVRDITTTLGLPSHRYYYTSKKYYGTNHFGSTEGIVESGVFSGTSAAAPVVTGVASLIYSLNPDFTPQEVKAILIDSASSYATERHTVKDYDDDDANKYADIPGHDIPILDAGAALQLAKDIVDAKKATLTHYYPSVFSKKCNIYVKPPTDTLHVSSLSLTVQGKKEDGSWIELTTFSPESSVLPDNTPEITFITNKKYVSYKAEGTVTYMGRNAIDVNTTFNQTLIEAQVTVKDKATGTAINGVETMVEYLDDFRVVDVDIKTVLDNNITYYFEKLSSYKVTITKENYKDYSEKVKYGEDYTALYEEDTFFLSSSSADETGDIGLEVSDENGTAITNAKVEMVALSTTVNSTYTDIWGIVKLLNIPIRNEVDEFIQYDVNISRLGYLSDIVTIALVDGKMVTEQVTLKKDPNYTNIPPVAQAGADQTISVGESITLSASASSDDETLNAYLQYKWSGISIDTSYDENITISNLAEGVHTIVLQVTDEDGAIATDTVTVTVAETGTITHNNTTYGTVTSPYTGKVWLDRNLGASQVCTSFDDSACYGDYYQWGRNYDGHQASTSSTTSTRATNVNSAGSSFITGSSDWASVDGAGTTRTDNWSATDGSSVCPSGFRVPSFAELRAETLDATNVTGSTKVTNSATAFSNFLKLPVAGYRNNYSGSLSRQGSWGYVWTSSVYGSSSRNVDFGSSGAYTHGYNRANGFTVRCLRD